MKSKKATLILTVLAVLGISTYVSMRASLVGTALRKEWIDNQFPEKLDEDMILPFGYTLGPWPKTFLSEPIVTQLTYQKGPPRKFIEKITQIWKPVEIELEIDGPRTIVAAKSADQWRLCFESAFSCHSDKELFLSKIFPDQNLHQKDRKALAWFDSLDPLAPRGIHLVIETATYQIDRYILITETGITQSFSLKAVKNPAGDEARALLQKTLSGLKVKEDLQSARDWIQTKIRSVRLDEVRKITDPKIRFARLIQIQNWIYSLLTVDPTHVDPYFHLAGVTHMLAIELMHSSQTYFTNQEAWILSFRPLFETLLAYAKDFPNSQAQIKNIEALLQDVLYEQNKLSH